MHCDLDLGRYDHGSKSWHTLGSRIAIVWNIIKIKFGSEKLWPVHSFWERVYCDLDLRDMTLGHGQQLWEILFRLDRSIRSYNPDMMWTDRQTGWNLYILYKNRKSFILKVFFQGTLPVSFKGHGQVHKVINLGFIWKGFFSWVFMYMQNMKSLSLMVQKLWQRLKFFLPQSHRQTGKNWMPPNCIGGGGIYSWKKEKLKEKQLL